MLSADICVAAHKHVVCRQHSGPGAVRHLRPKISEVFDMKSSETQKTNDCESSAHRSPDD